MAQRKAQHRQTFSGLQLPTPSREHRACRGSRCAQARETPQVLISQGAPLFIPLMPAVLPVCYPTQAASDVQMLTKDAKPSNLQVGPRRISQEMYGWPVPQPPSAGESARGMLQSVPRKAWVQQSTAFLNVQRLRTKHRHRCSREVSGPVIADRTELTRARRDCNWRAAGTQELVAIAPVRTFGTQAMNLVSALCVLSSETSNVWSEG